MHRYTVNQSFDWSGGSLKQEVRLVDSVLDGPVIESPEQSSHQEQAFQEHPQNGNVTQFSVQPGNREHEHESADNEEQGEREGEVGSRDQHQQDEHRDREEPVEPVDGLLDAVAKSALFLLLLVPGILPLSVHGGFKLRIHPHSLFLS